MQGYAVINLALLNPSKVEDLCLSKFIALVLQFISQKNKPVRSSALKQLLDYFRNGPCKGSFTAAGCYLCPAPGSKGTKILVCCSVFFASPLEKDVLRKLSYGQKHLSKCDISQIIADGKSHMAPLIPDASTVHFLNLKSSESLLVEAKRLNILSEFTFRNIISMQIDETERFRSVEGSDDKLKSKVKTVGFSLSETLQQGEVGYFMNRFLIEWDLTDKIYSNVIDGNQSAQIPKTKRNQSAHCNLCLLGCDDAAIVRHMIDADWLYLVKLSRDRHLEDSKVQRIPFNEIGQQMIDKTNVCAEYAHASAQRALVLLKSIPVAARRGLPVLDNPQGRLISIPSVGFKHCPCLMVSADFRPRVPLGGGHSSFI